MEINETANVSATLNAVAEGSNEVGTVYYSDAYSRVDDVEILELVDSSLTGDIIYPMSRVVNSEADEAQQNNNIDGSNQVVDVTESESTSSDSSSSSSSDSDSDSAESDSAA